MDQNRTDLSVEGAFSVKSSASTRNPISKPLEKSGAPLSKRICAETGKPQTITRKGRTAAVVVGAEEWERKTKRAGNLAEFFAGSPLRGSELKVRRNKARPRKVSL